MYAAFGLLRTRPAAGAHVGVLLSHGGGAGPAADRGEAVGDQRVGRQVMFGGVGVKLGLGPVGERVELQLAIVLLDYRQADAVAPMEALAAGEPGVEAL